MSDTPSCKPAKISSSSFTKLRELFFNRAISDLSKESGQLISLVIGRMGLLPIRSGSFGGPQPLQWLHYISWASCERSSNAIFDVRRSVYSKKLE